MRVYAMDQIRPFKKITTGVQGLDTILGGGILYGGTYLFIGPPGSGKTILANQIAFHQINQGGRALYTTLLAESHGRMFGHMISLDFFDQKQLANSYNFISGYHVLENEGFKGFLKFIGQAVIKFKASLIIIDGIASAENLSSNQITFKKFVHELNSILSTTGCTALLLSSMDTHNPNPEHTMVDGIIELSFLEREMTTSRQIEVKKLRGCNHLMGKHFYKITESGVSIFPRFEITRGLNYNNTTINLGKKISTGVPKLDEMLQGGIIPGETTTIMGPAGAGKTLLGNLCLLAGAKKKIPSYYFGMYEPPSRIIKKFDNLGINFKDYVDKKLIHLQWLQLSDHIVDEVLERILDHIKKHKIQLFFLEGVCGFEKSSLYRENRMHKVFTAFSNELRGMGITTLFTDETDILTKKFNSVSAVSNLSSVTDNIIYLQYNYYKNKLYHLLSIIKARESGADFGVHQIKILPKVGIEIGPPLKHEIINFLVDTTGKPSGRSR